MKSYCGVEHCMEVSGQLHAQTVLPPNKQPTVPMGQEAGLTPKIGLNTVDKRNIHLPLRGIEA